MSNQTDQFWAGTHGDAYRERQNETNLRRSYKAMWQRILTRMDLYPRSILELGANVGINLDILKKLCEPVVTWGVEPNAASCSAMLAKGHNVVQSTLQDWQTQSKWDLIFTRGVLIHTPPAYLPAAYAKIHAAANHWIVLAEYYNPTPVAIEYRGQQGLLWKRNFAGEMLNKYPDLRLVDYGFVYHLDPEYPQDDITWFLLSKE